MADLDRGASVLDAEAERKPKLKSPREHLSAVRELWRNGMPPGEKTGWPSVDKFYTVQPGQFTVITGWPGSGKSEWLDALLVNLSKKGWKVAIFSFENQPVSLHISKMMEKMAGKPFSHGPTERISEPEIDEYTDDIEQSFSFTETTSGGFTAKDVVEAATPWLSRFKESKRGLVIDPWNELEHWRPTGMSETEYISATLSMVRNWARTNNVHVWIVAHPQKVRREEGKLPVPRPDMISGSQHWWNKADACVTVFRDFDKPESREVDIHVQKVRFKHIGRIGLATLVYDVVTGRYHERLGAVRDYSERRG